MADWLEVLHRVVLGTVVAWLILVLDSWLEQRKRPGRAFLSDLLRPAPDAIRLLKRFATNRTVPIGVGVWLGIPLLNLLSPIDLVANIIQVLGCADEAPRRRDRAPLRHQTRRCL